VPAWGVEGFDLGRPDDEVLGLRKYSLPSMRTTSLAMEIALKKQEKTVKGYRTKS